MAKINLNKKSRRYLEIGVCCKTNKEHWTMLLLIVHIQSHYREHFAKNKRVNFRRLVEHAIKDLEDKKHAFYPFPKI